MATPRQLDLFADRGLTPPAASAAPATAAETPVRDPRALPDADLVAAIPLAGQAEAATLAGEAARRNLQTAVPALETLCRRFAGFGLDHPIAEQIAALQALTALGAKDSVTRLIHARVVRGPGRRWAYDAEAALGCDLAPELVAEGLRDDDPHLRAAACAHARPGLDIVPLLIDLLSDLHTHVSQAAARALGRLGRREGIANLLRQLAETPSRDVAEALIQVAGEDEWVRLSQAAARNPSLAPLVLAALEDTEAPRAAAIAASLRRRLDPAV